MATIDPPPGFRDELLAAIAVLDPEIDGLEDLMLASISPEAKEAVAIALGDRARRRDLERMLLDAMDSVGMHWDRLKADNYPVPPKAIASSDLVSELNKEAAGIAKAVRIFASSSLIVAIGLDLATVIHTAQSVPLS